MDYTLQELLDIPRLLDLLESLDEIHSMPSAIIDTEGTVLTATAWQDICTNFHRMNPETEKLCIESDRNIEARLGQSPPHIVYRCPLGLVDSAAPIIIEGRHLGNVFTGQLFLEPPDEADFIAQAHRFGFDEGEYLRAMRKVPMFSEVQLHKNLTFIAKLAQMLAEQGLQHKRQCEAEANLREAEWKFRALFDNGPIGVAYHRMIYDDTGKPVDYLFLDVNDKYIELTGIDPRGKTVIQAFPGFEDEEFDWIGTYGHVARTGETIRFEQYSRVVDRWYDCVGYQYKPDHFVAAFLDITQRKQAEARLLENEQSYRTLADSGQALIWKARPDKLCDYFNKVWLDFTGRTHEQEFGNGWAEGVHPDDFQHCLDTYVTAFDKREAFSMDYRLRRHDGEYRWLQDDGCPRYDKDSGFAGYIGYCLDITDRKLMEDKLRHASGEWRRTFDTIPDMITILDSEHRIVRANRATWQKLGCEREDLIGKPCYNFFHDSDCPPELCPHAQLMKDGMAQSLDVYELKLNGYLNVTVTPLHDADGQLIGSIHVAHDITELKQAGEELKKKNAEIEQFIYTVSHDLRSPLVTIKTFLGYLEGDMAENDQKRISADMQFINSAATKMESMLNELLEMSRLGHLETPPVRVSLAELISEALDTLAGVISERNVIIRLPETGLMLQGDRPRLCQVWQNLIDNAIKYSRADSSPRIELGVRQVGAETVFFVKDNGIGIENHYREKVFGMFEKLDPKSSGIGLGLPMVRKIVEKCGGRIWVESQGTGKGSCFFFTLPQAAPQIASSGGRV